MSRRKKDTTLVSEEKTISETEKIVETKIVETLPPIIDEDNDLEKDLQKFRDRTSNYKAPEQPIIQNPVSQTETTGEIILPDFNNFGQNLKVKMFLGLFCSLLSGFATFIFNFISKYEVEYSDMKLDEIEQKQLHFYLQNEKVIAWINKIPSEYVGIVHIGYIFKEKHDSVIKRKLADGTIKIKEKKKETETETETEQKN